MEHREGFFTGPRETRIFYQCWLPEGKPRAVLLLTHGIAEHCGRYTNVVNHFVPLGYAVYGFDNVGHGRSEGKRVHVERFEDLTDTLRIYHEMVRDWQPAAPIFLLGHSMGGLIVSAYLLDHEANVSGAVFSAPAVKVPPDISSMTIVVGRAISVLAPNFGLVRIDFDGLSHDPEVVQAYIEDPLVYQGKYTARMGAELLGAMQRVSVEAGKITLPALIVHGGDDYLIDPSASQELYDNIGSTDKTLKIYEGLYHEVHNEPERDQVLSDVQAWLEARLPAQG